MHMKMSLDQVLLSDVQIEQHPGMWDLFAHIPAGSWDKR